MRLAILTDWSTNRPGGFGLYVQITTTFSKVGGQNAFGDLEWPRMFLSVREQLFGVLRPSMLQAVLGNASVAKRMLKGWLKGLESA